MAAQTVPPRRRRRPTYRTVHVRSVEQVSPGMVSITLGSSELAGFATKGPAEHIKIFFPKPGQERPVMPDWGPHGPVMPPGVPFPTSRTYTPRRWNPETNELEVHIATQSGGVGAQWASSAVVGDTVVIAGPGRPFVPGDGATSLFLAGDESALPAIGSIVESLSPAMKATVYVEVLNESEEQPLTSAAALHVHWLHREPSGHDIPGQLLERTVLSAELPASLDGVWVACEAGIMRTIRKHLLYDKGLAHEVLVTRGYWKLGEANHPDHDMGEDV